MYKITTPKYIQMLEKAFDSKIPFMVYGPPGIGKSAIPRQLFPKKAKAMKRKYSEWSKMDRKTRLDAIDNPENYFVYCDQRVGQMDTTDLRGIPKLDGEWLEVCPLSWVVYFTQVKAAGVIMFDEINLAPPTVAGQAYQIIQERSIADRTLSDNVLVIAAGNRGLDKAFTFDMPLPLRDRFAEVELGVDSKGWTEWASLNKINSHLIAFVNWKPSYLYTLEDVAGSDKGASPRGIERASLMIGDADITEEKKENESSVLDFISASCGEAWANEFNGYVKHVRQLNWKTIISKPETVRNFEIDKLWAVAGGLPQYWTKNDNPEGVFDDVCSVIKNMREDFAIVTLRLMRDTNAALWKKCTKKSKLFKEIAKMYVKFLVDLPS